MAKARTHELTSRRTASRRAVRIALAVLAAVAAGGVHAQAEASTSLAAPDSPLIRSLLDEAQRREHGEGGMPKDPLGAAKLYCEAARLGNQEAQYSLGWLYANGNGVERHVGSAAALFALAAAQGHPHAERALENLPGANTATDSAPLPDCMITKAKPPAEPPPAVATAPPPAPEPPPRVVRMPIEERDPFADLPFEKRRIALYIRWLAPRYAVDPRLALAVARAESNFDAFARSPKNAQGVMQLIPATAERFGVRNVWDPFENIRGGLEYLRWLLAYYRGNVSFAIAAYNAGEGAVDRHGGIPPFLETVDYVAKIRALYPKPEHPFNPAVVGASPLLAKLPR